MNPDYFKINYNKLENLPEKKMFKFVLFIIIVIIILIYLAYSINIYHTFSTYALYKDNTIYLKINNRLSDAVIMSEYITFNNVKSTYIVESFGEYEIINQDIYQEVYLTIDEKLYDKEFGLIKFYYHKQNILMYILELFK